MPIVPDQTCSTLVEVDGKGQFCFGSGGSGPCTNLPPGCREAPQLHARATSISDPAHALAFVAEKVELTVIGRGGKIGLVERHAGAMQENLAANSAQAMAQRWGRIGARGQVMQHSFEREDEAVRLFLDLLQQKRKKGYRPSIGDGDAGSPIVASRKPTPPGGGAG